MSGICTFCNIRKPTNHLVLNGGALWLEFCEDCGKTKTLTNDKNEEFTIQEIFDSCTPQKPVEVMPLAEVKKEFNNTKKENHLREMRSRMAEDDIVDKEELELVMLLITQVYDSIITNRGLLPEHKSRFSTSYEYANNIIQFIIK